MVLQGPEDTSGSLGNQTPFEARATYAGRLAASTEAQMVNPTLITLVTSEPTLAELKEHSSC